jgi:predicted Zn-dependent protease
VGETFALQYSREHEMEADQVGLKYLVQAGYGGEGLLHVLQKIREKQWFGSQQIPSYLQTHPAVEARLAYLDTWIQVHPQWRTIPQGKKEGDFETMRAKLIALYKDPSIAHNTFDAAIRENPESAWGLYGKGVLLNREGDRNGAKDYLLKSIALRPFDGDVLRELGKIYFDMGSYTETIKVLRGALTLKGNDTESRFLLGQAQMKTGDLQGAVETLQALVMDEPDHLPALYHLGVAQGELNNFLEAHFNLGMYYKKRGEMDIARFHLSKALDLCQGDPGKKDEIQKALKELPKPEKSPLKSGLGVSSMASKNGIRTPGKIYHKQRGAP